MEKISPLFLPLLCAIFSSYLFAGCSDGECPENDPSYSLFIQNRAWFNPSDLPNDQCSVRNSPITMATPPNISDDFSDFDKDYVEITMDYSCVTSGCGRKSFTFKKGLGGFQVNNNGSSFTITGFRFDPSAVVDILPTFGGYYRTKCYDDDLCEVCNNDGSNFNSTLWEFITDPLNSSYVSTTLAGNNFYNEAELFWEVYDQGSINNNWPEGVSCHCDAKYDN
jgi:hypothetical protein